MNFISIHFLIFFPAVVVAYFLTPLRSRNGLLLGASIYFYAVWNPPYLAQILAAIWVAFFAARKISDSEEPGRKRWYLWGCLGILTANLFVFKYLSFANETLRSLAGWAGLPYAAPAFEFLLPIGISFYTFQLVSYVVDVYKGVMPAERRYTQLAMYLMFFPHLVAGPIERAVNLLPQFAEPARFDARRMTLGLELMLWGFFKKVVVADRLAPLVEHVYGEPQEQASIGFVLGTLCFAIQVYCDFSGYSDIAIGAAQCLGFKLTRNFNQPYSAVSIQDFWKRWHITLSTWLTDYIFTPLSRGNVFPVKWFYQILISLLVTFVVSGIWHGAKWTFVVWGAFHGCCLVASMLTQNWRRQVVKRLGLDRRPRLHRWVRMAMTLTLVFLSYVLFRANTMGDALYIWKQLVLGWSLNPLAGIDRFFEGQTPEFLLGVVAGGLVFLVESWQSSGSLREAIGRRPGWQRWSLYYAGLMAVILLGAFYGGGQQFIYFQF